MLKKLSFKLERYNKMYGNVYSQENHSYKAHILGFDFPCYQRLFWLFFLLKIFKIIIMFITVHLLIF